ncbi:MAG: type I DNA topoisomerase [Herpetosiphonaceae bacterium]|nr:type I DNA topoisomerase [Herpetosiphonaceae bacterium]
MPDKLVIVESPAKAKTIQKYLGPGYQVTASMGHVRDLPKSQLGVDLDNDFAPAYEVTPDKAKIVRELQAAIRGASAVYLATDPDREGEAIAWHITEATRIPRSKPVYRVEFNEITKGAVQAAVAHPREIDRHLVDAQQARRVLDRLVGYRLSPLLWDKVKRGLSAGRVQSVAVRLVVERDREITAFKPQEYWTIEADLLPASDAKPQKFRAVLIERAGKKLDKFALPTKAAADAILVDLDGASYRVTTITRKDKRRTAAPPFTTSTMAQEASRKLGYSPKRTAQIAQGLYEGIDIGGGEGPTGLITYMRTDSLNVAKEAQDEARDFVAEHYGPAYVPGKPNIYKTKSKGAQEAHEAIRPTSVRRTPEALRRYLNAEQFRLYDLIWKRFVASQMAAAIFDSTTVDIAAGRQLPAHGAGPYTFRATGSVLKFPGFLAVYHVGLDEGEEDEDQEALLPPLREDQLLRLVELLSAQHWTQPPPRYTEASLVKELERLGIGRPSTYAATISTITSRDYAQVTDKKLVPTTLGMVVNDLLVAHFPTIVDYNFTAQMEQELDDIAEGERAWVPVVRSFFEPFERTLATAKDEMRGVKGEVITTDIPCPTCGAPLAIKWGKRGEFLACSRHPDCSFTGDLARDDEGTIRLVAQPQLAEVEQICEKCGRPMALKKSRFGMFLACTGYPECKHTVNLQKASDGSLVSATPTVTDHACDKCGKPMVQKKGRYGMFLGCSGYPECNNIVNLDRSGQPKAPPQITAELCPACGKHMAIKQGRYGPFLSCTGYPTCRTLAKLPVDGSLPRLLSADEVAALPPEPKPLRAPAKRPKRTAAAETKPQRTAAKSSTTTRAPAKKATRTTSGSKPSTAPVAKKRTKLEPAVVAATASGVTRRPRAAKQPA